MKAKAPSFLVLQQQIAALPFDVLIRRIHSSSQKNPSRSLEAHFLGVSSFSVVVKRDGPSHVNLFTPNGLRAATDEAAASPLELRWILSQRLLMDVQQPRARLQLRLDDLSLILANALRHRLSPELVSTTLRLFIQALNTTGGSDSPSQQVEALSRVMEVCCDGLVESTAVRWDELAGLVATVEQRWSLFTKSNSLCSLLIQFLAAVITAQLPMESSPSRMLKAEPALLKERCLELTNDATDSLVEAMAAGGPLAWNPAELQAMCAVVAQLSHFEDSRNLPPSGSAGRRRIWRRVAAATTTTTTAAATKIASAEAAHVHKKLRYVVTAQVLTQGRLIGDVQAMTLQHAAGFFVSVSSACGTEGVDRFAVPVHNVLKRAVVGDASSMAHVIRIAEASLQVEGATLVLEEAIRCISRHAFVLTTGSTWNLLCSACAVLESAPLSMRTVVVKCVHALQLAVGTARRLPTDDSPEVESFRLGLAMVSTLLVTHDVCVSERMEEIMQSIVEAAPPVKDGGRGPATVIRCFFFFASTTGRHAGDEPHGGGKRERALHLAMVEAGRLLGEKADGGRSNSQHYLTSAERTMLRMAFKQARALTRSAQNELQQQPPQPPSSEENGECGRMPPPRNMGKAGQV